METYTICCLSNDLRIAATKFETKLIEYQLLIVLQAQPFDAKIEYSAKMHAYKHT